MIAWAQTSSSVTTAFLASFVEFVEALTIVLAVGATRGWRSSLLGAYLAAGTLGIAVVAFGPLLQRVPTTDLQLVIGILLLFFGFRWLRKAILRSAGIIALHDEDLIYKTEAAVLRACEDTVGRAKIYDPVAVLTSYKAVLLEGIEVMFIVISTGAGAGSVWPAAAGATIAGLLVVGIGLIVHRPLAMIPENQLKFVVGLWLSAFGIFWLGEGLGYPWPGGDLSIFILAVALGVVSSISVLLARRVVGQGQKS